MSCSMTDRDASSEATSALLRLPQVRRASQCLRAQRMGSGHEQLDRFLEGGLPIGGLTEWGAPLGFGGREVVLHWLTPRALDPSEQALWIHGWSDLKPYPAAWAARGVCLERTYFAFTERPLADLRPVFLESCFRLIVIDTPMRLSRETCAFLARRARLGNQVIIILRDRYLNTSTVWSRLVVNSWQATGSGRHHVEVVRGLSPRQFVLKPVQES